MDYFFIQEVLVAVLMPSSRVAWLIPLADSLAVRKKILHNGFFDNFSIMMGDAWNTQAS
jgi:hypothetical protein